MPEIEPYIIGAKVIVMHFKANGALTIWDTPGEIYEAYPYSSHYAVRRAGNNIEHFHHHELFSYTETLMEVFLEAVRTGYPGPIWN